MIAKSRVFFFPSIFCKLFLHQSVRRHDYKGQGKGHQSVKGIKQKEERKISKRQNVR